MNGQPNPFTVHVRSVCRLPLLPQRYEADEESPDSCESLMLNDATCHPDRRHLNGAGRVLRLLRRPRLDAPQGYPDNRSRPGICQLL